MPLGQMISPGVYTRIIDLSEFLQDVPGTIGFVPFLSRRGPDNKLVFTASRDRFRDTYGLPNILDYGKEFGQGPYVAWNHLSVSSHLYTLRCLPDDATFSHLVLGLQVVEEDLTFTTSSSSSVIPFERLEVTPLSFDGEWHLTAAGVTNDYTIPATTEEDEAADTTLAEAAAMNPAWVTKHPTINSVRDLDTLFDTYGENNSTSSYTSTTEIMYEALTGGTGIGDGLLMYFRGLGRGDSYNDFAIRISRNVNDELFGIYILDIYETQSDGDDVIIESFNVSFDQTLVDDSGQSLFIEDVVNTFSTNIRCKVNRRALNAMENYMMDFYKNDPSLPTGYEVFTVLDDDGLKTDLGYKATKIELAQNELASAEAALASDLEDLATARSLPTSTEDEIAARNTAVAAAIAEVSVSRSAVNAAKVDLENAYQLDMLALGDANTATAIIEPHHLANGSEGSLVYNDTTSGRRIVQSDTAKQVLSDGYLGLLKRADLEIREGYAYKEKYADDVLDLDWIYYTIVYDAGYPADVKDQALELVDQLRRDCVLISDVGDNVDYETVENYVGGNRSGTYSGSVRSWNSRYAARYEPYSKIYDTFTGRDIWVSPVYHMAQIIPTTDLNYELWYAPAGFNRATIADIKELRWSPKKGERDKLYLLQVNPIVHFPQGFTVWSQLTSQKRPTALQDLNIMRLVLYIKRAIEQFAKFFIFEFNDTQTHNQVKQEIIPFLDRIVQRRGLQSYNIEVGATEYEFKNKIMHINVTLEPTRVIEKIELNLYII